MMKTLVTYHQFNDSHCMSSGKSLYTSHLSVASVNIIDQQCIVFLSIDINDCNPSLCQHGGKCIDKVNDFECDCCPGWSGRNCEKCELDFLILECFGPSQVTYK